MKYTTLISVDQLAKHINESDWAIIDCRHYLTDPPLGRKRYEEGHISGALHADLDKDLSGPIIPGKTSRHPLPTIEAFAEILSDWGIGEATQVVAYDDAGGAIAARLWWMLGWMGHDAAAVLDGGWQHWLKNGQPTSNIGEQRPRQEFTPQPNPKLIYDANEVLAMRNSPDMLLIDSRSAVRFSGVEEPYDNISGHIPGAINAPYTDNLNAEGGFLKPEELNSRFKNILGEIPAERTVFYCGSGVTAAHNILALTHAGLGEAMIYPGSWSEWITDPARPVVKSDPKD